MHKYYTVTLKSRLRVTLGHWKRNHWIEHTRLTISRRSKPVAHNNRPLCWRRLCRTEDGSAYFCSAIPVAYMCRLLNFMSQSATCNGHGTWISILIVVCQEEDIQTRWVIDWQTATLRHFIPNSSIPHIHSLLHHPCCCWSHCTSTAVLCLSANPFYSTDCCIGLVLYCIQCSLD